MTAIVGVLNKHAVAIAADSAVTMGNTHKVVNSANKIFTLSKYYPVAIMTYNNADFMGVPWDIIIKEYRKQLKDNNFPHLKDYLYDFVNFLYDKCFFCDDKTQLNIMVLLLDSFLNLCRKELSQEKGIDVKNQTDAHLEEKFNQCLSNNRVAKKCPDFESYSYDDFKKYAFTSIDAYSKNKGISNSSLLCESFFYYLSAQLPTFLQTGLVFVGYGESEIFPSLYPIKIYH